MREREEWEKKGGGEGVGEDGEGGREGGRWQRWDS